MSLLPLRELQNALNTPKKVVVIPHKNPDGDALGSCLALQHFLNTLQHDCTVVSPNDFPDFLKWLPGADHIVIAESNLENAFSLIRSADLVFTLDFNDLSRAGLLENALVEYEGKAIMIDHHIDPKAYPTITYSDTSMSSTCEMVYNVITQLGGSEALTPAISSCLYTGIMTDTGSFKYPSATATTLRVAADLVDHGADKTSIAQALYDQGHLSRFKLMGRAIESLEVIAPHATALMYITEKDKSDCLFKRGDTEGFVNMGLQLKGVFFSVIFIENAEDQMIKISFRSSGDFDVNTFARKHFNGGGHKNAAGGRSEQSLSETLAYFRSLLPEYLSTLKSHL